MASFDENGKYIKTNWKAGDKITATKLNKIEESIEAVNDNDISRHVEADARLDALEAKDVAHDKELTNIKNTIAYNKAAAELGDYEINSRMQFLEQELNEGIAEVNNVASTVDSKIATAEANMAAQVNQGKADMETMVAEVEADLEGLHAKDEELSEQLADIENDVYNNVQLVNNTMSQEQIQNILNQGGFIKFLKGDYYFDLIELNCLVIASNSNIMFENGVTINLNSTNQENYNILKLIDVENVSIQGFATIVGDRYTHQGTTGEWGMGISIRGCNNIKIKDVTIKDCWGDGIYIGVSSNQGYSSNIITENVTCDNNMRQGLSIISVKGYLSRNDKMINTNGIAPEAGIDIEPNNSTDYLENITFENLYTAGNKSAGLMFFLSMLGASSDNHDVSVTVMNHVDNGSYVGCSIMAVGPNAVRGEIRIIKPLYKNNATNGLLFRNYQHIFPKVYVDTPTIIDCNRNGLTSDVYANAVNIFREESDNGDNAIGNLCITNLIIDVDPSEIRGSMYIADRVTDGPGLVDVEILNPIKIVTGTRGQVWLPSEGVRVNDINNVFTRTYKSSATCATYSYATHINNEGATMLITLTLSELYPLNEEITFTNMTSYGIDLKLSNATFIGFNNTGTNTLAIRDIYGSITLKRISETEWAIINKTGNYI